MKKLLISFSGIIILLLASTCIGYGNNKLSLTRSATNTLEVQLSNSEEIYSVQFSLRTSSDVVLGELERDFRTTEEHWLVASYKPNDTVINVIIISMQSKYFSNGNGALAKISFTTEKPNEISSALLANVIITNKNADSLSVAINNLDWSNKPIITANKNESKSFAYSQNFPNPFNPTTIITYRLNKPAQVRLSVYDITGREVNRLVDRYQSVGDYNISWNSNDENGQKMASGMYFARLNVDNESVTRKMVMTK
jgi:FlgD Ig-like domain